MEAKIQAMAALRCDLNRSTQHFHLRAIESFIKTGETQCEHGV